MKTLVPLACFAMLAGMVSAQTPAPAAKLSSDLFDWTKLEVTPNAKGERRAVFDGATATIDKIPSPSRRILRVSMNSTTFADSFAPQTLRL